MNTKSPGIQVFKSESEEADWWASPTGRTYLKQKAAEAQVAGAKPKGSSLVASQNKKRSI